MRRRKFLTWLAAILPTGLATTVRAHIADQEPDLPATSIPPRAPGAEAHVAWEDEECGVLGKVDRYSFRIRNHEGRIGRLDLVMTLPTGEEGPSDEFYFFVEENLRGIRNGHGFNLPLAGEANRALEFLKDLEDYLRSPGIVAQNRDAVLNSLKISIITMSTKLLYWYHFEQVADVRYAFSASSEQASALRAEAREIMSERFK